MYKGGGPGGIINFIDTTLGKKTTTHKSSTIATEQPAIHDDLQQHHNHHILLDPDTTKNQLEKRTFIDEEKQLLEKKNNVNDSHHNSNDKDKKKIKMMRLPSGEQLSEEDQKFFDRVQNSLRTVQHWESDTKLFEKVRNEIVPWDDLRNTTGPYSKSEDRLFRESNALFLQRLCRWFPTFMSWVNAPPCVKCGCKECEMKTVRGAETQEEKDGGAKRVEVYYCPGCKENTTTFPRYNKASKLLETRKGRCGEYSNLFGLVCRSVGFETRLVLDLSDHLWTEIRLGDSWIMADACEGIIDKPSMYEYGWGKSGLCYMLGIGRDSVTDVTPRYTRKFLTEDFQTRRREHTTSEERSEKIIHYINSDLSKKVTKQRAEENSRRKRMEEAELNHCKQMTEWTDNEKYGRGRISGSFAWKQARQETGKNGSDDDRSNATISRRQVAGFDVETFFPPKTIEGGKITFQLNPNPSNRHDGIIVSNTACAVGEANSISVVVVDDQSFGCILQSKSFFTWPELVNFVDSLPSDRFVLMNGKIEIGNETKPEDFYKEVSIGRLGGWNGKLVAEKGVMYIGQVDAQPDWTFFTTIDDSDVENYEVEIEPVQSDSQVTERLRTERATVPLRVAARLPEAFMPLRTQSIASDEQKRRAFTAFLESESAPRYSGYTSKSNCPVYLLDASSYPLQRLDKTTVEVMGKDDTWNTFIGVPEPLVPTDDHGLIDTATTASKPSYEVPLETRFFDSSLGPSLLTDINNRVQTSDALANNRLIGLYFSAHWCGPCRSFTPMLAEMYEHLTEAYPSHGLEIVFVSGDRDEPSFRNYYQSMPWRAIPFDQLQFHKQALNMTYGVRGIPSFVVLDAVSGQVVVPASQSRQEVMNACSGGEQQIESMLESWLSRTPSSTHELLSMLELSTQEEKKEHEEDPDDNPYMKRIGAANGDNLDLSARIKMHFDRLVNSGHDPNSAAATALNMVGNSAKDPGRFNGKASYQGPSRRINPIDKMLSNVAQWNVASSVSAVLSTAQKYLKNAVREPWEPKFRTIKLSNKVADTVTQVEGGWALLEALGFEVSATSQDFKANIPVATDLVNMNESIAQVMEKAKAVCK